MPPQPTNTAASAGGASGKSDEETAKLVQKIADRVWELWQQEVRQTHERRGTKHGR